VLKAVIFDMDGVIIDSHPAHKRAWCEFLLSIGRAVSDEELEFVLDGRRRDDILRFFLGELTEQQFYDYGVKKTQFFYRAAADLELTSGLLQFMARLDQADIPMAVASSGSRARVERILSSYGIADRFSTVVTGDDVKLGKPNPEIYVRACEAINVPPSSTLVVEDAVSGVKGAKVAGTRCLGIATSTRAPLLYEAGADLVVADFDGIQLSALEVAVFV
jgi:beta-phosphoglucomutase